MKTLVQVGAELDALYRTLPPLDCQGKCQHSCARPVMFSHAERARSKTPAGNPGAACPELDAAGRCRIYAQRPTLCRLWGVLESQACPHGCKPTRYLTDQEGAALLGQAMRLGSSQILFP